MPQGRFEAHIWNNGKQVHLGSFTTQEQAAHAYDAAALKMRGWGAETNFPTELYAEDPLLVAHLEADEQARDETRRTPQRDATRRGATRDGLHRLSTAP